MVWQRPPSSFRQRHPVHSLANQRSRPTPGAPRVLEGPIPQTTIRRPLRFEPQLHPAGTVLGVQPPARPRMGGGITVGVLLVVASIAVLASQGVFALRREAPVHESGPRRGPPHVVRLATSKNVWSELRVVDGQRGGYKGQFVHSVKGSLHVNGRVICARPLLYLNGRLLVRGYRRCGCETLSFNAWSTTREMPYYGPRGARFRLVWTDHFSRRHPSWKFQ